MPYANGRSVENGDRFVGKTLSGVSIKGTVKTEAIQCDHAIPALQDVIAEESYHVEDAPLSFGISEMEMRERCKDIRNKEDLCRTIDTLTKRETHCGNYSFANSGFPGTGRLSRAEQAVSNMLKVALEGEE
jgi:hypothetical protein